MIEDLFKYHSDAVDPKNLRLLGLMIEMGGTGPDLLAALLNLADVKLDADDRRFLLGPFVVHGQTWRSDLPDWIFQQGRAERFEIVVEKKPGLIGPAELTAVMYGATIDAPLRRELTDLYLWASVNACVRHYRRDRDELWKTLDMAPIEDREVIERGGRLWQDYQTLAEAIRRKVIRAQTEREHDEKRRAKDEATREKSREEWREKQANRDFYNGRKNREPEKPEPVGTQPRLV